MKKSSKLMSLLLTFSLSATLLAACSGEAAPSTTGSSTTQGTSASSDASSEGSDSSESASESESESQSESESTTEGGSGSDTPLVVGYSAFSGKFSPFFADTAYDQDAQAMTQVALLTTDRSGAIIFNGIEGETHEYAGTEYTYTGISDLTIDRTDATTTYTFKLREGVLFSDGEELTADDVIFNLYAYLDPSYVGSSTMQSLPIQGLQEYRTQSSPELAEKYTALFEDIYAAGRDHEWSEADGWTKEQQDSVWAHIETEWKDDLQATVDFVMAEYGAQSATYMGYDFEELKANEGLQIAFGAMMWGFADYSQVVEEGESTAAEDAPFILTLGDKKYDLEAGEYPTIDDLYEVAYAGYKGNPDEYSAVEQADSDSVTGAAASAFVSEWGPKDEGSEGAYENIAGIKKVDEYTVAITLDGFDASAVYKLGIQIAPLHYYGDEALYDYENNKFGFPYNDLSILEEKTDKPMGAGAYMFDSYENKLITFKANPNYYKGEPKTKTIHFREVSENDKTSGVAQGTIDITDPSFSATVVDEIKSYNEDTKDINGKVITSSTVDNLGYGYIGINADTVKVGDDAASEESKNLRKGISTVLSAYRELSVSSYYGERASVINYPISNTSWAAPQETDEGYEIAYSRDVEGNPIYTSDMEAEDRYAAALDAAVGFFVAAGYTFDEASGKLTAAPEGAKLSYEAIVPAEGSGNHPSFQLLNETSNALAEIGFELEINDPADSNVLWDSLDAGTQELWAAAWGATIDPDMYQVYHSSNVIDLPNSSESNHYHIADPELDELIMEARSSEDQEFRKATYKAALDIILDWGVEIPVYQRQNVIIFSTERVNMDTITPDITTFWGWMNDIELVEMNPEA